MYAYRQTSYGSHYFEEYIGEINNDYNLNFVLDGTKDNAKVEICNYNSNIIAPYTILKEEITNTWWVVKKDRVERHQNENGYFYIHQLELLGAVEILNARDLTDCGFNANRYTIRESISRLFRLANVDTEFSSVLFTSTNSIDLDQTVTFTKTYENYTLLSALKELLNAYNCDLKIHFNTLSGTPVYITSLQIDIYAKTGDSSANPVELDTAFNDVRELKELDSNSFGSVAVSNANNVIASNSITFPSAGWTRLSSDIYEIDTFAPDLPLTNENARASAKNLFIRLPNDTFKVNYVDVTSVYDTAFVEIRKNGTRVGNSIPIIASNIIKTKQNILQEVQNIGDTDFTDYVSSNIDEVASALVKIDIWRFYDGVIYNPQTHALTIPDNAPSDFKIIGVDNEGGTNQAPFMLYDKDQRDHLHSIEEGFYWERGTNKIGGWERFAITHGFDTKHLFISDSLAQDVNNLFSYGEYTFASIETEQDITLWTIFARVNYIPMSDIKIKIDNDVDTHNIKLFNQTGKLTDGVAFSKRLESYSKEISSDNITRYNQTYSFDDIYKVGTAFTSNGEIYVINNVSTNVIKSDTSYFFDNEYTLSKQVAVKSLMVNPNTNIRDYLIPQTNNVVRKTLFRDYYTFDISHTIPTNTFSYVDFSNLGIFVQEPSGEDTFFVGITTTISNGSGYTNYYYQLSTSRFNLKKIKIYTLNFNDNNIIGYDCQNRWSGFNIQRLVNNTKFVTVPIQYTDDIGEVYSLKLAYCTKDQTETAYKNLGDNYMSYCSTAVYINSTVYDELEDESSFVVNFSGYRKDALEVPFFEYCIQFGDSNSVLVGDNVLTNVDDCIYIFGWGKSSSSRVLTQENFSLFESLHTSCMTYVEGGKVTSIGITRWARVFYSNNTISFVFYPSAVMNWSTKTIGGYVDPVTDSGSYAIYRFAINKKTGRVVQTDLMFILKNVKASDFNDEYLEVAVNHYELK